MGMVLIVLMFLGGVVLLDAGALGLMQSEYWVVKIVGALAWFVIMYYGSGLGQIMNRGWRRHKEQKNQTAKDQTTTHQKDQSTPR
jgi:hypothetical protein